MEIYYGLRGRLCKGVRLIPGGGACAIVRVACAMLGFWVSARVRLASARIRRRDRGQVRGTVRSSQGYGEAWSGVRRGVVRDRVMVRVGIIVFPSINEARLRNKAQ